MSKDDEVFERAKKNVDALKKEHLKRGKKLREENRRDEVEEQLKLRSLFEFCVRKFRKKGFFVHLFPDCIGIACQIEHLGKDIGHTNGRYDKFEIARPSSPLDVVITSGDGPSTFRLVFSDDVARSDKVSKRLSNAGREEVVNALGIYYASTSDSSFINGESKRLEAMKELNKIRFEKNTEPLIWKTIGLALVIGVISIFALN